MKSAPKRAFKGSATTPHHGGAEENPMKLRRIASVNGTKIVRYQCLCCTSNDSTTSKHVKYSQRSKLKT